MQPTRQSKGTAPTKQPHHALSSPLSRASPSGKLAQPCSTIWMPVAPLIPSGLRPHPQAQTMKQAWSLEVSQTLTVQPAEYCSSHPQSCVASSSGTSLLNASATSSRNKSSPSATCALQPQTQSGTLPLCHPCQMSPRQTCLVPTRPCPIIEQQSALLPMAFLIRTNPAALRQLPPAP